MQQRITALRRLLAGELPLHKVGPQLRDAARRALRTGDDKRMLSVVQGAASELLRRGELLRVAVEGDTESTSGPFCLVRGTNRLIDLSVLGGEDIATPLQGDGFAIIRRRPPDQNKNELDDVSELLHIMEQAQDFDLGDPQSGDKGVILNGVLGLLSRYTPQFQLFIQVADPDEIPEDAPCIFALAEEESAHGWYDLRPHGHSVWIPTLQEMPEHLRAASAESGGASFRNAAVVPLLGPDASGDAGQEGEEAGLLYLVAMDDWGRDSMLRLAERLSGFVTRRWRSQRDVNRRIHRDSLTGTFNRAYFDSQFPIELERARRSHVPLTLVIVDIDHFKVINDTHGHQVGDRVLRMVARRLHEELRRIDHVCRIGGEEFALILPDTSQEAGQEVVGRLLEAAFEESAVGDDADGALDVTFSYGGVTFPAAGADPFELFRKADAMLYMSKDLGRNQCHFWSSQGDHIRLLPEASGG